MISTKEAIAEAYLSLASKKNIDKITVKDIVEACSITRQTFYYHFKDIMDVIEWSFQQQMEKILEESIKSRSMEDTFMILLEAIDQNIEIINKLMQSQKRAQTEKLIYTTIRTYLQEMMIRREVCLDLPYIDVEMALTFYSCAISGVLFNLGNHPRNRADNRRAAEQLSRLVRGEMLPSDEKNKG